MADAVSSRPETRPGWRRILRFLLALIGLFLCYRLIVDSARAGVSGLFTVTAFIQSTVGPADTAVRFAPGDPEAHYTRALELVNAERLSEAVDELRQATRLRPHHYQQWLDLGVTLDRVGDQAGAVAAVRESVRLAPGFALPRWQLGNLLFQQEQYQEAFAELRLAARTNPNWFEQTQELAWLASNGDVPKFLAFTKPDSKASLFSAGRYLAVKQEWAESARQAAAAGEPETERDRALLHQTITRLLAAQQFALAFQVWSVTHAASGDGDVTNGEFSEPISQDDPGFGWQILPQQNVSVAVDPTGPTSTSRSLLLTFSGESNPQNALLQQLVLVRPNTGYSLNFAFKSQEIVSGGLPTLTILDVSNSTPKILAQSRTLAAEGSDWTVSKVDFSTAGQTAAVLVSLQRLPCAQSQCPIFGRLWLATFRLTKK